MSSLAARLANFLRVPASSSSHATSLVFGVQRSSKMRYSSGSFDGKNDDRNMDEADDELDDFFVEKQELQPQGVDPRRGWGFRGVHKAIICGKVKDTPVQKILRNGKTVTIFSVGTGGLFDQRIVGSKDLPKPVQWHRIAVHNEVLGSYAVKQLVKNSSVYVEGDIEIRVYNDSINGEVKNIPEICIRRDDYQEGNMRVWSDILVMHMIHFTDYQEGTLRLVKSGESISKISFDDLREGLL